MCLQHFSISTGLDIAPFCHGTASKFLFFDGSLIFVAVATGDAGYWVDLRLFKFSVDWYLNCVSSVMWCALAGFEPMSFSYVV